MFPSPCGDVVLKFEFEADGRMRIGMVSVPLRGCGFEIIFMNSISDAFRLFPSPCGDVVLKLFIGFRNGWFL